MVNALSLTPYPICMCINSKGVTPNLTSPGVRSGSHCFSVCSVVLACGEPLALSLGMGVSTMRVLPNRLLLWIVAEELSKGCCLQINRHFYFYFYFLLGYKLFTWKLIEQAPNYENFILPMHLYMLFFTLIVLWGVENFTSSALIIFFIF